jgi:hypothetical protein
MTMKNSETLTTQARRSTTRRKNTRTAIVVSMLVAVALFGGRSGANPGFTFTWTTNQLNLTVTNHTSGALYEIYARPVVGDPAYPWTWIGRGVVNQTNFTITNYVVEPTGFFELAVGSDWDSDGVANDIDAQPNNSGVGALTITIDFPTQGLVLQ